MRWGGAQELGYFNFATKFMPASTLSLPNACGRCAGFGYFDTQLMGSDMSRFNPGTEGLVPHTQG